MKNLRDEVAKEIKYKNENQISKMYKAKKDAPKLEIANKLIGRARAKENLTVKMWLDDMLNNKISVKLTELAKSLPPIGYSMGERIEVRFLKFTGISDDRKNYSKSCKYKPTWGYFRLRLTVDDFKNSKNIGGLFTYIYPNQRTKVKKCWWYEAQGQKNNYSLKKVNGFLCGDYHAKTKQEAVDGFAKRSDYLKNKQRLIFLANLSDADYKKLFKKALRLQYGYQDSINAGNCEAGTRAFIMRCGLNSELKYRGKFLLDIAKEKSTSSVRFVEKMIAMKIKQQ